MNIERIQGTDGIRRAVRRQDEPALAALTPWQAFVEEGVITDAFLEGYAFAFAKWWLAEYGASREVVVAWDPRDPAGVFTAAVVRGVRKAGATAVVLGTAATPAVPMLVLSRRAAAGLQVTASHNPPGQNGVKVFLGPVGLKPLPADDRRLTRAVAALDWPAVARARASGGVVDASAEGREVFRRFHMAPANGWCDAAAAPLDDFIVVVDPARGSYSGLAAAVIAGYGAEVVEVNADEGDGRVNWRSGVADLEGVSAFAAATAAPGGRFEEYPALGALAALARRYERPLARGERILSAVIFDADGDRLFLIIYDPAAGDFAVLTGDEIAILEAGHVRREWGRAVEGYAFMNTVESDLAVAAAAEALGFAPALKPVGDKWILTAAWRLAVGVAAGGESAAALSAAIAEKLAATRTPVAAAEIPFAIGCEETGHAITFGELARPGGDAAVPFAAGNGLKAALNVLAAVAALRRELPSAELYPHLRAPFARGYKGNNYVFFTDKAALSRGGAAYDFMAREMARAMATFAPGLKPERIIFAEEPDLLYWGGYDGGRQVLGVFCRNSGTEEKSALYVRAEAGWAEAAAALERELYPKFYAALKDVADERSRQEVAWLAGGRGPEDVELRRVIETVEGVVTADGITARGEAVREELRRAGKL